MNPQVRLDMLGVAIVFALSLWLRQAFPITALGNAGHDDLLFVQLAAHMGSGQWLGPYGDLTMAKGAAYSAFILASHVTGVPLKLMEHFLYLSAALYFSATLGRLFGSRLALPVCFSFIALNPVVWAADVGGRVVREGLYASLSLFLLALCVRVFVLKPADSWAGDPRAKRGELAALGFVAAAYWLTREEGAWLVPSILVLLAYWLVRSIRTGPRRKARSIAAFLAIPVACFCAVVGAVNLANFVKYGVFRNNDFRSADFQAAYGALSRIEHDEWRPYVLFPSDARGKAYAVSAAAQELKPFFEGEGGERWRKVSCEQTGVSPCPEILAGWFMWALRQAVAEAGHYGNAVDARNYYRRVAGEINAACDRGAIACAPRHDSLIPPWHPSYLSATARAVRSIFGTLISLGNTSPHVAPSIGSDDQLALFQRMTHGPLAPRQAAESNDVRQTIATGIAALQVRLTSILVPLGLIAWPVLLAVAIAARRWHPAQVVMASLAAAVAMRVGLLGFLEATAIPSNNILYLSPVVPMALALGPCVVFLLLASLKLRSEDPFPSFTRPSA